MSPCLQGKMSSWQPQCSDVRSLLWFQSACTRTACIRNCLEVKLLLYEISPLVGLSAGFPEAQGNLGDQEICSVAFTTVQSCPV